MKRPGYNGFVAPADAGAVADRIRRVFADRDTYAVMSENATDVAARYTWENVVDGMIEVMGGSIDRGVDT